LLFQGFRRVFSRFPWRLQKQETDLTLVLTSLERLAFAELKRTATEGKIDENNVAETVHGLFFHRFLH